MALAPNTGFGLLNPGTTTPGSTTPVAPPIAQSDPAPPGWIGGSGQVAPPVFNPGPTLPHIPGATVTYTGNGQANPFPGGQAPYIPAAPTLAPTAAPNGGGGQSGLNIDNLPGVSNTIALEQQGLSQLDAALKSARDRAIINYGDPALASLAGFGIDPQAGAFAQQNYLSGNSTLSRLDAAHKKAAQGIINQLASHGLLNSGELGYDQGQENQAYGNNVYGAQQSVLNSLSDLYNNYTSNRSNLEQGVNDARLNALQSYLSNPDAYAGLFGTQSVPSSLPAATTSTKVKKDTSDALSRYLRNAA